MGSSSIDPQAIAAMPPSVLATIPGQAPPPGVIPNMINPQSNVSLIIGLSNVFLAFASVTFLLRIWTKAFVVKKWSWDDLTITLGFMCSIVHFAVVVRGSLYGGTGKHQWDVSVLTLMNAPSLQQSYITVIMVTPALGLIKLSLLIQYYVLFNIRRYIRVSVWIAAVIFGLFYISVSITSFVLSSPWHGESLPQTIVSWHYLKFAKFAIPTGVIGMVADWFLFFIPMPAVWALHMPLGRKIGVLLIFATGGLAAIASIISLYYRVHIQRSLSDVTWTVGYVVLWSQIEMFAGVTASSMPTVRQFCGNQELLKSWGSSFKRSIRRSSGDSAGQDSPLGAHVATLREWVKSNSQGDAEQDEESKTGDIEVAPTTRSHVADSACSLNKEKDDASMSLQSVSSGSFR